MNLLNKLKDPKTNWKYILIVVVSAFIVGGMSVRTYWQLKTQETPTIEPREITTIEKEMCKEVPIPRGVPIMKYFGAYQVSFTSEPEIPREIVNIIIEEEAPMWMVLDCPIDTKEKPIESKQALLDLNGDTEEEFMIIPIYVCGKRVAGATNAPILVFQKSKDGWKVIGRFSGNAIAVAETKTERFKNIMVYEHFSSYSGTLRYYRWNGSLSKYTEEQSFSIDCFQHPEQCNW